MITLDDDAQRLPRNPCRRLRRALITALSDPQPLPPRRRPTSRLSEPKADRCESDVLRDSRVSARKATYLVLSGANTAARRFETFLIALVITNVVLVIIDSDPYVGTGQGTAFRVGYMAFELFSLLVFIAEYAARLWSCVESPGGPVACCGWNARLRWRLAYASTPLAIIDLASIPPFAFDLIFEKDDRMRGISLIRTLRIISLLRLERSFRSFARVLTVLGNQRSELGVAAFVAAILLLMSAATIYYLENPAQPEHFRSIFSSMWWAVTALTTVGYGDVYPVTTAGKMFGSVVAFLGVGFFALPAGIVGSGFMELVLREKQEKETRRAHELRRRAIERRRRRARGAGHGRLAEGERGRRAGGAGGGGAAGGGGGREGGRGEVEDCDREHDHEEEQEEEEEDGSSRDELETIQAALRALRREQHALAAALLEERASLLQQQHRQRSSGSGWWDQAAAAGESVPAGEPPRYEARSL